ncbi:hypothetical protein HMPREF3039_02418 [Akkermansia sp. KLE1798]|nr:hypothetical protein HMPREF3039_02418 [Akkermansia sp. KLE1798]
MLEKRKNCRFWKRSGKNRSHPCNFCKGREEDRQAVCQGKLRDAHLTEQQFFHEFRSKGAFCENY